MSPFQDRPFAVAEVCVRDLILLRRVRVYLLGRRSILSPFEVETIREADARVRAGLGGISPAERLVIQDALDAMVAAARQQVSGAAA